MTAGDLDLAELASAIHQARIERGTTMADVARETGVAAATIRRYETAADAEADGVLALVGWLGATPERFIADSTVEGTPLPPTGDGMNRVDMDEVRALPSWPPSSRSVERTTIQRLVAAAQCDGRTIASLTRRSSG